MKNRSIFFETEKGVWHVPPVPAYINNYCNGHTLNQYKIIFEWISAESDGNLYAISVQKKDIIYSGECFYISTQRPCYEFIVVLKVFDVINDVQGHVIEIINITVALGNGTESS